MVKLSPARRFLKVFHPEGIPWPGTVFYDAISATDIFQRNYELVAEHISEYGAEGSILDIGTGPGWLPVKLLQLSPLLQVTGMDNSPSMVARAEKNIAGAGLAGEIDIRAGDASNMPFDADTFDIVVSTGSVHHWKDPVSGLTDVYRVLKPGGYALIYDIISDTPRSVLRETARRFGRLRMVMLWLHAFEEPFYSYADFRSLAESSPFKEGQTRFVGVLCCLILKKGLGILVPDTGRDSGV